MLTIDDLEPIFQECLSNFVYDESQMNPATYHWDTDEQLVSQLQSTYGKVKGICADFALYCRMELDKKGISNTLVWCLDELRESHLVCNASGYVLDNRQKHVMTNTGLEQEDYLFLAESGTVAGEPWHLIEK